jgi:hypothetical protein
MYYYSLSSLLGDIKTSLNGNALFTENITASTTSAILNDMQYCYCYYDGKFLTLILELGMIVLKTPR